MRKKLNVSKKEEIKDEIVSLRQSIHENEFEQEFKNHFENKDFNWNNEDAKQVKFAESLVTYAASSTSSIDPVRQEKVKHYQLFKDDTVFDKLAIFEGEVGKNANGNAD